MLWSRQLQGLLLVSFRILHVFASPQQHFDMSFEIIFPNDLLGAESPSTKAVFLLDNLISNQDAGIACAALHESLVDMRDLDNAMIQRIRAVSQDPHTRHWIRSTSAACLAIDLAGTVSNVSCKERLPVLCTQSAPFSNSTYADNSVNWQTEVQSGNQVITGYRDRIGFRFLGVRYAEQPKRFTHSRVFDKPGHQSAISYGAECVQAYSQAGSEDCLFLNIFTTHLPGMKPRLGAKKLKPVMIYIHGGGFLLGSGSLSIYDGGNFASRGDVVVVTLNYRLGAFGYLALGDGSTNGNFGLSDQVTALDWVIDNIASFGGDPSQITISGQSAGALSVTALLRSARAMGKYAAAMPLSNLGGLGSTEGYVNYPSVATVALQMNPLLEATGCLNATSQAECLRAIDPSVLSAHCPNNLYIVVDGVYINSSRLVLDGSEHIADIHLLMGSLRDEAAALITYPNTTNPTQAIEDAGFNASKYDARLFPVPSGSNTTLEVFNMTTHFATDAMARCFDQAFAYTGSLSGVFKSVWYYQYERSYQDENFDANWPVCDAPIDEEHPYGDTSRPYFKCHGGDVYYVFGNIMRSGKRLRDHMDLPFSQLIVDSLSSFVRTHNPNPSLRYLRSMNYESTLTQALMPGGTWKSVTSAADPVRLLDWPPQQGAFREIEQCERLGIPLNFFA